MPECKLCGQQRKLIKSHIIPNWMFKDLFNSQHKIYKIQPSEYLQNNTKKQTLYNGEYECNLLCENCDNIIIGQLEHYAKNIFYNTDTSTWKNHITPDGCKYIQIKNIDYKKFKLFLMSILWRASISKRPFFKGINLPQKDENTIKDMLINNDAGRDTDYPVIICEYLKNLSILKDLIGEPNQTKNCCSFIINGFIYIFHITNNDLPPFLSTFTINQKGELKIFNIEKNSAKNLLKNYFRIEI